MKKTILISIITVMLFNLNLIAQEKINYLEKKNEFNIQVDNIFSKTQIYLRDYQYYENGSYINAITLTNQPAIGIGYKHHFTKGAIRAKISAGTFGSVYQDQIYGQDDYEDESAFVSHYENISLGYEWHSNLGRTQIFYGLDAHLSLSFSKSSFKDDDYYYKTDYDSEVKHSSISFGAKPFLGFKFFISPQFSVSTEYHVLIENYSTKISRINTEVSDENSERIRGMRTSFGPMGQITFSFHF